MKSSVARRADLKSALKRFKENETITLDDLARLWGVVKARFINLRNDITEFPEPVGKQGNTHLYRARPAIQALLDHEMRNDRAEAAKSSKVARILGASSKTDEDSPLPATEMLALAKVGAEVDKRRVEQGELVRFVDVQEVATEVFGEISAFLSKLSDTIDPNGKLAAPVRAAVDDAGKDALLRLYKSLDDMLGDDAHKRADPVKAPRAKSARSRRPRIRRKAA